MIFGANAAAQVLIVRVLALHRGTRGCAYVDARMWQVPCVLHKMVAFRGRCSSSSLHEYGPPDAISASNSCVTAWRDWGGKGVR